jgi:galactoside O-acetyltransferase
LTNQSPFSLIGLKQCSYWSFLRKLCDEVNNFIEAFVVVVPGATGNKLRFLYFRSRFSALGSEATISSGFHVLGAEAVYVGRSFTCGRGCSLYADDGGQITICDGVSINSNVSINAAIGGEIFIGNDVLIGPGVLMRAADHAFSRTDMPIRLQGHVAGKIHIEDDVWIGGNVTVLAGAVIRRGAVIAAGAVVRCEVPAFSVVGGVPARLLKWRDDSLSDSPDLTEK